MSRVISRSAGRGIQAHWNELTSLGRLQLILEYADLFLSLRLVTESEFVAVRKMSPREWEYILTREDHPIFTSLDLNQMAEEQCHHYKLIAALKAVFNA